MIGTPIISTNIVKCCLHFMHYLAKLKSSLFAEGAVFAKTDLRYLLDVQKPTFAEDVHPFLAYMPKSYVPQLVCF